VREKVVFSSRLVMHTLIGFRFTRNQNTLESPDANSPNAPPFFTRVIFPAHLPRKH
jgi:hypothetical protein